MRIKSTTFDEPIPEGTYTTEITGGAFNPLGASLDYMIVRGKHKGKRFTSQLSINASTRTDTHQHTRR